MKCASSITNVAARPACALAGRRWAAPAQPTPSLPPPLPTPPTPPPPTTNQPVGSGQGWRRVLQQPRPVRCAGAVRGDAQIAFDRVSAHPAAGLIGADDFSVRWTNAVNFPSGLYRFRITVDDGARVFVHDQLVIVRLASTGRRYLRLRRHRIGRQRPDPLSISRTPAKARRTDLVRNGRCAAADAHPAACRGNVDGGVLQQHRPGRLPGARARRGRRHRLQLGNGFAGAGRHHPG